MSRTTKNLGLVKLETSDRYTYDVFNQNLQKIDEHFGLLGSSMGNKTSTGVDKITSKASGDFEVTAARIRRAGRLGYFRVSIKLKKERSVTASGRLAGGAFLVAGIVREMYPIGYVGLQTVDQGSYNAEGMIDPQGNIFLSSINTRPGRTSVAADSTIQLSSGWYVLKGDL